MRSRIQFLEDELQRKDAILLNMTEAMKALNPPAPEDAEEARESTQTFEEEQEFKNERARREMAESTMRAGMDEEARRREESERERDRLRRELFALRQQRESPETADEQQGTGEPRPATGGTQEGARRPWWRKLIGR